MIPRTICVILGLLAIPFLVTNAAASPSDEVERLTGSLDCDLIEYAREVVLSEKFATKVALENEGACCYAAYYTYVREVDDGYEYYRTRASVPCAGA